MFKHSRLKCSNTLAWSEASAQVVEILLLYIVENEVLKLVQKKSRKCLNTLD